MDVKDPKYYKLYNSLHRPTSNVILIPEKGEINRYIRYAMLDLVARNPEITRKKIAEEIGISQISLTSWTDDVKNNKKNCSCSYDVLIKIIDYLKEKGY